MVAKTKPRVLLDKTGLDGYFALRYLRMLILVCVFGLLITWPILFPVNAVNGLGDIGGISGLDRLTISNLVNVNRYWAHVVISYVFVLGTLFLMNWELRHFVNVRQQYLTSPEYARKSRARTILITSVPANWLDEAALRKAYDPLPGGVESIWLNRDFSKLLKLINQRDKTYQKLEAAEIKLLRKLLKLRRKDKEFAGRTDIVEQMKVPARPQHRLKPLFGKKVDTIDWCRRRIQECNKEIAHGRDNIEGFKPLNSVFIRFNHQLAAYLACQSVAHENPMYMTPRYIEIGTTDVVWRHMQLQWWVRLLRLSGIICIVAAMIIFWAVPTGFIGSISNITYLVNHLPWLGFINGLPEKLLGIITGVLPAALLSLVLFLVPFILRGTSYALHTRILTLSSIGQSTRASNVDVTRTGRPRYVFFIPCKWPCN